MVCVAPFRIMRGAPCDAAARQAGGVEGRGGVAPSPRSPTESTSHRARGCWRECMRDTHTHTHTDTHTHTERGGKERKEIACACVFVCACGLHHRIPFTVSAGGRALMEIINPH
ncbi:hypothetical protein ILYODFUR_008459 [Ilyodon furcidens]|uniref:Uncharacterized protein n=1 Tax=Ilyodon furcidens TaxID=33524 RepID=A0ABV0TWR7_9TELE